MTDAVANGGTQGEVSSDLRLTLIGPLPPPVNGQSVVMSHMVSILAPHFANMRVADTAEGAGPDWLHTFATLRRSVSSWRSIPGSDVVYVAVKAGKGMWLTSATVSLARLFGARVFLHHHSYAYVRTRMPRMVALSRAAGTRARHILLSQSMANDLVDVMPEIKEPLILGNACLVDRELLELPEKGDRCELVLGHLSNLTADKGIAEVVSLASALREARVQVRLIVGGPTADDEARLQLIRATQELGDLFEYRGSLTGDAKLKFFNEITHFVFPTRYVHEAVPLVLYEAMAAGAVCVATTQGSIFEQLKGSPAVLASCAKSFVEETVPMLRDQPISAAASRASRQAFLAALSKAEWQLADLVTLLGRA